MEFIKSFFHSGASTLLQLSTRRSTLSPEIMTLSVDLGMLAILSHGAVYLLNNDTCRMLIEISDVVDMYFISDYLWIISTDIKIIDTKSGQITLLESSLTFKGNQKGIVVYDCQVNVFSGSGKLEDTLTVQNQVLDVFLESNSLFVGQESLITIYNLESKTSREISTLGLLKITLLKDRVVVVSKNKIRFYKLQESMFKKNVKEFQVQEFTDVLKVFSTLQEIIVVSSDKISVFHYNQQKELVLDKEITDLKRIVDVFLKGEELLILHEKEISSVNIKQGKKIEVLIPDFEFSKRAKESLKRFCGCGEFVRGEYSAKKTDISGFLSTNKYFSETKKRSWDLLALFRDKRCEIWDPWTKEVLKVLDFTEYVKKTEIDSIIFNSRYLLVIGGTSVVVYRFITSADLEMAKRIDQDLERAMASLDNVVDSALKEAKNVKDLLAGPSAEQDADLVQVEGSVTLETSPQIQSEFAQDEAIHSGLNDDQLNDDPNLSEEDKTNDDNFYTVGSIIAEIYDSDQQSPGWYPLCKIVTDEIVNNVILDLDNDLIAILSNSHEIKVGRISDPRTFLSLENQGQKSISILSFAKLFLSNGEISTFLIYITLDGTVFSIHIDVSDPIELRSGLIVTIQKSISESPVAVYILDDNGSLLQNSSECQELSLICVFKQSIRIFLFNRTGSHELFQEKKTDSKDGMIVKSGVFANDSGSFLGVLFTSGVLQVYCLPDLSVSFRNKLECDIRFMEDSFISSLGYVYIWSSLEKLDIFEFGVNQKEEDTLSHSYSMPESKTPREQLKNIVRQKLGENDTNSAGENGSKNMSNELQMKMNERGEALAALETKFSDLSTDTGNFLKKIKDYNEKQVQNQN